MRWIFFRWLINGSSQDKGPLAVAPERTEDQNKQHKEALRAERNSFLTIFFGLNLAWMVLMLVVEIEGNKLGFSLSNFFVTTEETCPVEESVTVSPSPSNETCLYGFCGYPCKYNEQNPLSFMFLLFYLVLLIIQFVSMLSHRWSSVLTYFSLKNTSVDGKFSNVKNGFKNFTFDRNGEYKTE